MKKTFALAVGLILVPLIAFGLEPMTEAEMDALRAQSGLSQEANDDGTIQPRSNDDDAALMDQPILLSGDRSETASRPKVGTAGNSGAGVAIFIDDVKVFFGGSEVWYQNNNAAIGISSD